MKKFSVICGISLMTIGAVIFYVFGVIVAPANFWAYILGLILLTIGFVLIKSPSKLIKYTKSFVISVSIILLLSVSSLTYFFMGSVGTFYIYNLGIDQESAHITEFNGFGMPDSSGQTQSCFKWRLNNGNVNVVSPCYGVISSVKFQSDHGDYAVDITPKSTSGVLMFGYTINMDHVLNPVVKSGQFVKPDDVLGTVGAPSGGMEFMTEIDITKGGFDNIHQAPFNFFEPSLKHEYEQKVYNLMARLGTSYDAAEMIYAGCYITSLPQSYYDSSDLAHMSYGGGSDDVIKICIIVISLIVAFAWGFALYWFVIRQQIKKRKLQ